MHYGTETSANFSMIRILKKLLIIYLFVQCISQVIYFKLDLSNLGCFEEAGNHCFKKQ